MSNTPKNVAAAGQPGDSTLRAGDSPSTTPAGSPLLTAAECDALHDAVFDGAVVEYVEALLAAQRERIAEAIEARIVHAPKPTLLACALFDEAARTARNT